MDSYPFSRLAYYRNRHVAGTPHHTYYQLEQRRQDIPRYLFRTYHRTSGGLPTLNTPSAITPLAFHLNQSHPSIYEIGLDLPHMLHAHLHTDFAFTTEFSTWSSSLLYVLCLALNRQHLGREDVHICILDTTLLPPNSAIYPVPAFFETRLLYGENHWWYSMEYLAHGVIKGAGFMAVPFERLVQRGVVDFLPVGDGSSQELSIYGIVERAERYGADRLEAKALVWQEDIDCAFHVASDFGKRFGLPVLAGLLSILPRPSLKMDGKYGGLDDPNILEGIVTRLMRLDVDIPWTFGSEMVVWPCHEGETVSWDIDGRAAKSLLHDVEQMQSFLRTISRKRWEGWTIGNWVAWFKRPWKWNDQINEHAEDQVGGPVVERVTVPVRTLRREVEERNWWISETPKYVEQIPPPPVVRMEFRYS
ncbi:MAG: hypothetical protein M1820_009291 [Bogoriella megaspora]|nr:MAG: hypothetical protein M1820_009291 [Bogoriella megaspora]